MKRFRIVEILQHQEKAEVRLQYQKCDNTVGFKLPCEYFLCIISGGEAHSVLQKSTLTSCQLKILLLSLVLFQHSSYQLSFCKVYLVQHHVLWKDCEQYTRLYGIPLAAATCSQSLKILCSRNTESNFGLFKYSQVSPKYKAALTHSKNCRVMKQKVNKCAKYPVTFHAILCSVEVLCDYSKTIQVNNAFTDLKKTPDHNTM